MPASDALLDDLLKAIYADPSSDAARLAYADALGDDSPHAKLIRAQIARGARRPSVEEAATEAALIAGSERWHGALPRSGEAFIRFDRGFPSGISTGVLALAAGVDHPAWGTVERLWIEDCESVPWDLLRRPTLRSVRSLFVWPLIGPGDEFRNLSIARDLLTSSELPLTELVLTVSTAKGEFAAQRFDRRRGLRGRARTTG